LEPSKLSDFVKVNEAFPTQWIARMSDNRLMWVEYEHGMLSIRKSFAITDDADDAINGINIFNLCLSHDIDDSFISDYELFQILEQLDLLKLGFFENLYYSFKELVWEPMREALFGPQYFFVITSEDFEDEDTEENDNGD
jgi:hypothetical protein